MKFGKSYMETLASPSFPKEWREGAIEYKQLKKLINGVVAELESLGLGADVLRDLIVGTEGGDSDDDDDEDEDASQSEQDPIEDLDDRDASATATAPLSGASAVATDTTHGEHATTSDDDSHSFSLPASHFHAHARRRASAPHHSTTISRSSSQDVNSMGSSADDCDECAKDLARHQKHHAENAHADTPASEWVAHIAHAQHSRRRGRRHSSWRVNTLRNEPGIDGGGGADGNVTYLRPPTIHSDTFRETGTSTDENGALASSSAKLGKKELESLRQRRSNSFAYDEGGRPRLSSYRPSTTSSHTSSHKKSSDDRVHDWGGMAWRERSGLQPNTAANKSAGQAGSAAAHAQSNGATHKRKWVQGKDGRRARAEYELGGTSEKPIPRIRLYVESPIQSDEEVTAGDEADSEGGEDDEDDNDDDEEDEEVKREDDDDGRITELDEARRQSVGTIKPLQGQPRSPIIRPTPPDGHKKRMRTREIVIPLSADTEFLDTLTGALSNLSSLQDTQREQFQHSTETLCNVVSQVTSPYGNKNDLYAWREIFSLWCELQIFESQREKDRGELSVDETEARLKKFADELAKRGWNTEAFAKDAANRAEAAAAVASVHKKGKLAGTLSKFKKDGKNSGGTGSGGALPMKDPRSVAALEDFLKLNLALLDVKKFQRVNVEAARKILKKHDKRTALTASSDLSAFVAQQERMRAATASAVAGVGISSLVNIPEHAVASNSALVASHGASTHPSLAALLPSSTSALMSSSLPHILLSLMTSTLLPILPSIDDYGCAICTGVAWRPIKLDCSHLFCIRCLVKLQKQGKNDCPLCRAKDVVGSADERNMDPEMVQYLKSWFPKEVAEKEKEDKVDRHKEEMFELGLALENEKCVVT